ncbi:transposase Tn3 [Streptantibioticus cattleyicolor NRRL 8057 = DSM 46488]|uniref:Transposase Tn3 n=1 Tax=Streptantibioticus cattleyicolor (strain ATCC 35852 / DSM 46488 / JCM 4925 / NBRC 14057 / NRRL 8057) TaxID=1003195 RepID=F8JVX3_STREN|nr:transposase Tn3 [Streptantibioticus cattleyicolor NRRL 8057 = DSM 46488]CCB72880.1 protein of unknown function [Streptantibioticus cattleyicolor NRRL 8057 = DSM 46488]
MVYEVVAFQALRDQLKCKEIWVVGADKWRNPDEDLPQDFAERREENYRELRKPLDPQVFVDELREQMTVELGMLNDRLPKMGWLEIAERKSGRRRLPLRSGQRVRERRAGCRPPDLRRQYRAHPPGRTERAVGRPPPHRRTPHLGVRARSHSRLVRAAPRVRQRPGSLRGRSVAQPGADPAPLLQQQRLPGPGTSGGQPPSDSRAGVRRTGVARSRALRWRRGPGSTTGQ